jgi:hypothetical protein
MLCSWTVQAMFRLRSCHVRGPMWVLPTCDSMCLLFAARLLLLFAGGVYPICCLLCVLPACILQTILVCSGMHDVFFCVLTCALWVFTLCSSLICPSALTVYVLPVFLLSLLLTDHVNYMCILSIILFILHQHIYLYICFLCACPSLFPMFFLLVFLYSMFVLCITFSVLTMSVLTMFLLCSN